MYSIIDVDKWKRKHQFSFFKEYDDPCFNVTAALDVTALADWCKSNQSSFFLSSLFCVTQAINGVDELRFRLVEGEVRDYNKIVTGCTILRPDMTFGFGYFDYANSLEKFLRQGRQVVDSIKQGSDLVPRDDTVNLIHCSVLPWFHFTSFKHARDYSKNHSVPKVVLGKYTELNGRLMMPISIEVMHALVDGYHIGQFYHQLDQSIVDIVEEKF